MRNARELEPHFDTAQRAEQREVVEIAEVADAKHFVAELAQPASERHVEALEYGFPESDFAVTLRHEHSGKRARILGRIETQDLEPPSAYGAARGFRVTIVPLEDVLQALLVDQHLEGFAQSVKQVRRRRIREETVFVRAHHFVPRPIRAWQL